MKSFIVKIIMAVVVCSLMSTGAQAQTVNNLTFKETDIKVVLQAITQLAHREGKDINIVPGPAVAGTVTIDLAQVDWETALDVICRTYKLDAYRQRNVIIVTPLGPDGSSSGSEIQVKVFVLNYIDANDALKAIKSMLSSVGKASVLETTGQSGWKFGALTGSSSNKSGTSDDKLKRTKILIVSDSRERLGQIATVLDELDLMPKQILIKARIMEVNHDFLKDLGVEWGTGANGVSALATVGSANNFEFGARSVSPTPSTFLPQTSALTSGNGGLNLEFKRITGTEFDVLLHTLEESTQVNTLSAPLITTLNNQEATILIGSKFPIIQTSVSTTTNNIIGGSLQEYKDIGIQLNVVPQIWGENDEYINLIVHPAISSYSTTAKVIDINGTTLVEYPIISTREAETQLIVPDNGTVMMGGLLKDVKNDQTVGVPGLSKIPILGNLFKRKVDGTEKIELVIFLTAHIMKPGEQVPISIIDADSIQANFENNTQAGE